MLLVLRYRKTRVLDVCLDFPRIDVGQAHFPETLADKEFGSRDMIGGQARVRGACGYLHELAVFATNIMSVTVTPTYSPYIADVVAQERNHEMEPIAWGNPALAGVLPEQDLLTDQRHHDGVVHVVVGRVTIGNILQREATDETNDVRIGWLKDAVDLAVLVFKLPDKRLDDDFSRIEHGRLCCTGSGVHATTRS